MFSAWAPVLPVEGFLCPRVTRGVKIMVTHWLFWRAQRICWGLIKCCWLLSSLLWHWHIDQYLLQLHHAGNFAEVCKPGSVFVEHAGSFLFLQPQQIPASYSGRRLSFNNGNCSGTFLTGWGDLDGWGFSSLQAAAAPFCIVVAWLRVGSDTTISPLPGRICQKSRERTPLPSPWGQWVHGRIDVLLCSEKHDSDGDDETKTPLSMSLFWTASSWRPD